MNCHAHARCLNETGLMECRCDIGYQGNGSVCEEINPCQDNSSNLCHHFAECQHTGPGARSWIISHFHSAIVFTKCCQRPATAATLLQKELCCACAMTWIWAPQTRCMLRRNTVTSTSKRHFYPSYYLSFLMLRTPLCATLFLMRNIKQKLIQ